MSTLEFPSDIHEALGYYVYRLIDPRDGSTFYVGKGVGNRVFAHVNESIKLQDDEDNASEKLSTIRQIRNIGLEPIHIIHRHGLSEIEAFAVEAALIDATPGLTNIVSGKYSNEFGPAHVAQLISRYSTTTFERDNEHNLMLISINQTIDERSIYDAVRYAWVASLEKARKADFVLAVSKGLCREVFYPQEWMPALKSNFPALSEDLSNRIGFNGTLAPETIRQRYRLKRLPEEMMPKKGAANPVRYFYRSET